VPVIRSVEDARRAVAFSRLRPWGPEGAAPVMRPSSTPTVTATWRTWTTTTW